MSEFKGTEGEWVLDSDSYSNINGVIKWSVYSGTKRIALCYGVFEVDNITEEEGKANALLISKAPEMLEFIKTYYRYLNLDDQLKAEQLIKEATEL